MTPSLIHVHKGGSILWTLKSGNILDEPADILVCSANVSLNLSGGVGAELLGRYGMKMQKELHHLLATRTPRIAPRGEVVVYQGDELPYRTVLHAVAVDGWYNSSPDIIKEIVSKCLKLGGQSRVGKIAMTALGTGYGDLTLEAFGDGIRPLLNGCFGSVKEVCICLLEDYRCKQLADALFTASPP